MHAVAHDIPVAGYENQVVNTIRLWSAKSPKAFDLSYCRLSFYLLVYLFPVITEIICASVMNF